MSDVNCSKGDTGALYRLYSIICGSKPFHRFIANSPIGNYCYEDCYLGYIPMTQPVRETRECPEEILNDPT